MDPFQNYAIRLHYDSLELATIAQNDSVKFSTIRYYYTQSYLFETVACQCAPPSADHFDISEYEYLRKRNVRVERYFEKYGFKLTLFAINELQYRLPIQNP
ncbi:MAG: hypothetical protein O9353_10635 [Bacteroidia bacterium]|nr:hypothetical protein [Bacteroidia bacterium]